MTVPDMLEILTHFGVRSDLITTEEKAFYLHYLNLAHLELYALTASLNENTLSKEATGEVTDGFFDLPEEPFKVLCVTDQNQRLKLKPITLSRLKTFYPLFSENAPLEGTPQYFVLKGRRLFVVPFKETTLIVFYLPQAPVLNAQTEESALPYPAVFHPLLIEGALKYLVQDVETSSLKDEMRIRLATHAWESGKGRFVTYLGGKDPQSLRSLQEYF
jgi:hypothetical protein